MKTILPARHSLAKMNKQRGAVMLMIALLMIVFLGIAALVIDVSAQYVVRNQLQNAADAGALAGASVLYLDEGKTVNSGANQVAYDTAKENIALSVDGAVSVDVNWPGDNIGDVQRGHWSFGDRQFTPNPSLDPVDLWNLTTEELDNPASGFINAVRVVARRSDTQAPSFFARIFGYTGFAREAEAVAYIGFAGTLKPQDVEQPIAICKQSIINDDDGTLTCTTGRMTNSGSNANTHNTGAWTNFTQPCVQATPNSVSNHVCGSGNPNAINLGTGIGATGGELANVASEFRDCWMSTPDLLKDPWGYPREKWSLALPVIDCPGNNPGNCSIVVGSVSLDIIWVNSGGSDPQWREVPYQMEDWECSLWVAAGRPTGSRNNLLDSSSNRQECWREFAEHFNLQTAGGESVGNLSPSELKSAIYFLPSCEPQEPRGVTGGENFGILAKIPVLVK